MEYTSLLGKAHRGKTVILGDDDIPGTNTVYQGKVHTVCALVKYQRLGTLPAHFVGGVAEKKADKLLLTAKGDGNVCYGTSVGIH